MQKKQQHTKQQRSSSEYALALDVLEVSAHAFILTGAGSSVRADVDCGGGSEPDSVASIPALGRRAAAQRLRRITPKHARR